MELKGYQLGAEIIYTKECKMRSERWAGTHSVNCGKKFGFGISFEMQWKFKTVLNRGRNDNHDQI